MRYDFLKGEVPSTPYVNKQIDLFRGTRSHT